MMDEGTVQLFQDINRRVVHLIDSLSVLSALADLEVENQSEAEFLRELLKILMDNVDLSICAAYRLEDERLQRVAWADSHEVYLQDNPQAPVAGRDYFELGQGEVGQCASGQATLQFPTQGMPALFFDDSGEADLSGEIVESNPQPGSLICIPVVHRKETLAVLAFYHPAPAHFNQSYQFFFNLLSRMLAQIMANQRYSRQLEQDVSLRMQQLQQALREARQLQMQFQELSQVDERTSLPNRRWFLTSAQPALSRAIRYRRDFACCLIDIGNYAKVLEALGSFETEHWMAEIGAVLQKQMREGDLLAYYGGNEFILALPETDETAAITCVERLQQQIVKVRRQTADGIQTPQARFGVAILGHQESTQDSAAQLQALMTRADLALQLCRRRACESYTILPGNPDRRSAG